MTLSDISIRKPVFAWMLMAGLIVFGSICFSRMGISQLPDVDFPVVTVSVTWTGASPESVESAVTDVIEDSVMSIEGIRSVSSTCQEGISNTTIEFDLSRNIDVALQEVQTKISQAARKLPDDIDPAVVKKSNPDDQPILWAALTGGTDLREKILFARDKLKDQITTVSGVGDVNLGGYVDPNMRVWLNSDKMRTKQISVDDVSNALKSGSSLTPTGYMDSGSKETNLKVLSEASTPEEFESLVIPTRGGAPIWTKLHLRDVARVEEGLADVRKVARLNGLPAVGLGIIKQRGSNAVAVGQQVKERIRYLKDFVPKNMSIAPVTDSTKFIEDSTHELLFTLGLSAILTAIVCWVFLGSLSSAFNVVLAIPVSLIGTFIMLYFFGFTINTFTLLALSLSIGIVVDDAIMVLENIVRYSEMGMSRVKASLVGAREITGAAVAASLAILAIFLPVIFMKGIIGKYFFQFGVAMSVAVMISLLEALTLAPMRCSEFLSTGHGNVVSRKVNGWLDKLAHQYHRALGSCLNHRWKVVGIAVAVFVGSLGLIKIIRQEFVPPQDQSRFLVSVQTPMGSSLDFTDQTVRKLENALKDRPEVDSTFIILGGFGGGLVNQANMFITLQDKGKRTVKAPFTHEPTQQEFMAWARGVFTKTEGVTRASMIDLSLSGFSSGRGYPVQFQIQGPEWSTLASVNQEFMKRMQANPLLTDAFTDYNPNMPEVKVFPDQDKASERGVTITNIATTIGAMVGSLQVGKYTDSAGRRNDVRVKLEDQFNKSINDVNRIWVRNNRGEMIPLSDVMTTKPSSSLLTIGRYNRERTVTLFANLAPNKSQKDAMAFIDQTAKEILPAGYHIVYSGSSQTTNESADSLMLALILGIFVAYMVLATQYNSFIHPIVVLTALPFSFIGAFGALAITNTSLNIYSMIGILLLMGIVKKNSILIVDFTNHRRKAGLGVREALLEACPLRLRPILMTSIATIAAVVPAALALGPGSETTRPMAIVVIGGVSTSTFLTLLVVPCVYSLFSGLEGKKHQQDIEDALDELAYEERERMKAAEAKLTAPKAIHSRKGPQAPDTAPA
jgi:hydrophobe/amphiphile efflux-1 (HAE1) family protein